ncbi:PTS sugar transporter subunit IIB [Oenococcus oeni]
MTISLTRVDFRLIHGQVITQWLKQKDINKIVTIDTGLSKDDFMQEVFKMAVPKGVRLQIIASQEAAKAQKNGDFDHGKVLILFKTVAELYEAVENGLELTEVQIGGLGGGVGRKTVNNAISLDKKDADLLEDLQKNEGIEIYLQTTPDYPRSSLVDALAKFNS